MSQKWGHKAKKKKKGYYWFQLYSSLIYQSLQFYEPQHVFALNIETEQFSFLHLIDYIYKQSEVQ